LRPVNAENFVQYKGSLEIGQTPKIGSCMVWQKGNTLSNSDGAGHVAIVEKVVSNTEVYTSESGWNSKPFWNQTRKKGDGNWGQNSSYKFLGFIYNPAVDDSTIVSPTQTIPQQTNTNINTNRIDTVEEVQKWANTNYKSGLMVDGIYGANTKKALIKILQTEINQTYNKQLKVDGIWGQKTKDACPTLSIGAKNDVVGVLQAILICNGYKQVYLDNSYGSVTYNAVKSYQDKMNLDLDGSAGKNTFAKLCS
jgi:peptidoglycan hydrolase-like protein with peptidoglycan-binding domain